MTDTPDFRDLVGDDIRLVARERGGEVEIVGQRRALREHERPSVVQQREPVRLRERRRDLHQRSERLPVVARAEIPDPARVREHVGEDQDALVLEDCVGCRRDRGDVGLDGGVAPALEVAFGVVGLAADLIHFGAPCSPLPGTG